MSRYLFTICGRAGSKGIKGKNAGFFLEIPLVYYTLAAIQLYQEHHPESDVVIALNTDSEDLRQLLDSSAVSYEYIPREQSLADDAVGKVDVIRATYRQVCQNLGTDFDAVVDFDITSPLRTLEDIEVLLAKRETSEAGVVFTVTQSRRNPYFNMVKRNEDGTCSKVIDSNFTARQQAPTVFDMNASMYAYSKDFMEGESAIFDSPCDYTVMKDTAVLDLDHPEDLELMQVIARYLFDTDVQMSAVRKRAEDMAGLPLGSGLAI